MQQPPLHTIIIDDEANSCEIIQLLLRQYHPDLEVTGTANSFLTGIQLIREKKPQLVFLDLELQDGSGADVLSAILEPTFEVIFVTAFEQNFLRAIRFSELQLILKPIDRQLLRNAVDHVKQALTQKNNKARYQLLLENLEVQHEEDYKLILPVNDSRSSVIKKLSDIIWLEQHNGSTVVYLEEGPFTVAHPFRYYIDLLGGLHFFRITNLQMINLRYLRYMDAGKNEIRLSNGQTFTVAPHRIIELRDL